MISNQQRRETAKELCNQLKYMRVNADWYNGERDLVECGNRAYRNIAHSVEKCSNLRSGYYIRIVEQLAELIDRPTCRNVSGCKDTFECSECRLKVDVVGEEGNEYGDVFSTPFMPRYCPNCGKEVVE